MAEYFIARFRRANDFLVVAGFTAIHAILAALLIFFSQEPAIKMIGELWLALSVLALLLLPVCGIAKLGAEKRPVLSYLLGVVSAALIVLVWLTLCVVWLPDYRSYDTFTKGALGDNITAFEKTIGGPPEQIVKLPGHYQINYYPNGGRPRQRELIVTEVSRQDEVPDIYDRLQILVGPDQTVKAIGWNGETTRIRTLLGEFPGANLNQLPVEAFDTLVASDGS